MGVKRVNPDESPLGSRFGRGASVKLLDSQHRGYKISLSPMTDASIIEEHVDMNTPRQDYTA